MQSHINKFKSHLIPLCALLFCAVPSIAQTTFNATFHCTNFVSLPASINRVVLTPLKPFVDYTNVILVDTPIVSQTDTNGNVTFSNLISGYSYLFELDASFKTVYRTNGFPSGLTGNVNAEPYIGLWLPGQTLFAYISTNQISTITLAAGTNIVVTTNGSTFTISVSNSASGSGGITNLDGMTNVWQLFSVGTSGSDFNLSTNSGTNHVWNLPTASAIVRGALSSSDWSTFNNKLATNGNGGGLIGFTSSQIPGLSATNINSGTISVSRLPASVLPSANTLVLRDVLGNIISNVFVQNFLQPTNTYTSTASISAVVNSHSFTSTTHTFSGWHAGWQFTTIPDNQQYWVTRVITDNSVYAYSINMGGNSAYTNVAALISPAAEYASDNNGVKDAFSIGGDGAVMISGENGFGNSASLYFANDEDTVSLVVANPGNTTSHRFSVETKIGEPFTVYLSAPNESVFVNNVGALDVNNGITNKNGAVSFPGSNTFTGGINSSTQNTFSGGNVFSGTNLFSGPSNTFSSPAYFTGGLTATAMTNLNGFLLKTNSSFVADAFGTTNGNARFMALTNGDVGIVTSPVGGTTSNFTAVFGANGTSTLNGNVNIKANSLLTMSGTSSAIDVGTIELGENTTLSSTMLIVKSTATASSDGTGITFGRPDLGPWIRVYATNLIFTAAGGAGLSQIAMGGLGIGTTNNAGNGNLLASGTGTFTNGVGSLATDAPIIIQATGISNASTTKNWVAYVTCTATTFTNFNNAGTAVLTNTTATFNNQLFILQPGGSIKAAAGLSGVIIPF